MGSSFDTAKLEAVYRGGAVALRSELANLTPQLKVAVQAPCPHCCSTFPDAQMHHTIPVMVTRAMAAAMPVASAAVGAAVGAGAGSDVGGPAPVATAPPEPSQDRWWDMPTATTVTDSKPMHAAAAPNSLEPAPYPTYTYPAPETAHAEIVVSYTPSYQQPPGTHDPAVGSVL